MRYLAVVTAWALAALLTGCRNRQPVPPDAEAPLAIRDVTIVDVVDGMLRPHSMVIVEGHLITAVVPSADSLVPPNARLLDGAGRFLIPGLWDMHSHALWSREAVRTFLPAYAAQGITGIRDMGGRLDILAAVRDSLESGQRPWPRIVAAGVVLDGPTPVQPDISLAVADSAEAAAAVDSLARSGADFIKVYTLLPREAYLAVLARARRHGLSVAGHVPADVTPEQAARAGQQSIEHLRDEIETLCSPQAPETCAHLADVFRSEHTWQVPTLVTLQANAVFSDSSVASDPRLRFIPSGLRADWLTERRSKIERGPAYAAGKRERFADASRVTGFLADADVPLLAGSDAGSAFCYPGFSLHDELVLLVGAGLTPLNALRAATVAPAAFLNARDSLGTIETGHVADLVLLKSNPLADIAATREIEAVVLRGRLLDRADLDRLLDAVAAAAAR